MKWVVLIFLLCAHASLGEEATPSPAPTSEAVKETPSESIPAAVNATSANATSVLSQIKSSLRAENVVLKSLNGNLKKLRKELRAERNHLKHLKASKGKNATEAVTATDGTQIDSSFLKINVDAEIVLAKQQLKAKRVHVRQARKKVKEQRRKVRKLKKRKKRELKKKRREEKRRRRELYRIAKGLTPEALKALNITRPITKRGGKKRRKRADKRKKKKRSKKSKVAVKIDGTVENANSTATNSTDSKVKKSRKRKSKKSKKNKKKARKNKKRSKKQKAKESEVSVENSGNSTNSGNSSPEIEKNAAENTDVKTNATSEEKKD